jgi:hypothetical protein
LCCKLFDYNGDFYVEENVFFDYWYDLLPNHRNKITRWHKEAFKADPAMKSLSQNVRYDCNQLNQKGRLLHNVRFINIVWVSILLS